MRKFEPETKLILRAKKVSKQKISPKFTKRTKSPNVCCMFIHKSLLNYGIPYRAQCQLGEPSRLNFQNSRRCRDGLDSSARGAE